MKNKVPFFVLLAVAIGLGAALVIVDKHAVEVQHEAAHSVAAASNTLITVKKQKDELALVNQTLETNLAAERLTFSNKLTEAETNLRLAESNLEKITLASSAELKTITESNAAVIAQRDQKISELENQNAALDREAASLHLSITNLDRRIADTEGKLARSEGDRVFLTKELKTLKAEKEELLHRFNDIAAVREQLHKLKIEASLARKLDHERRAIEESFKSGKDNLAALPAQPAPPPASGGTVELRRGGGVSIEAPAPAPATNAPPR